MPLPVKVQISDSKYISFSMNNANRTSQQNVHSLGILTVHEVYEEIYFLSNAVTLTDGKIDSTATLIPLYLADILISPITGIEGKSWEEWQTYQDQLSDECKKVQIPLDTGLKEIAIYSPNSIAKSENIYEYIEPSSYIVADWEGKTNEGTYTVTKQTLRPPPIKPKPPKPLPPASPDKGPPLIPARQAKPQPSPDNIKSDQRNPPYANVFKKATVAPFAQIAKDAAKRAAGIDVRAVTENKAEVQGQQEDKPVAQLTIEELADKLKDLKLEKYLKAFKEQGVDGELATDLDETILREEFKFSKFECLKFLKFVKSGHVPK